ncbi:MAG: serine hydrolase [Clostridia bacterium]|nr:serine hydrolase [Clostridia bacterium]
MSRRIFLLLFVLFLLAGSLFSCSLVSDPETERSSLTDSLERTEPSEEPEISETEPVTEIPAQTETETETETEEPVTEPPIPPIGINELEPVGKELFTYGISGDCSELEELLAAYPNKLTIAAYAMDGRKILLYDTESTHHSACTIKAGYILYVCKQLDSGAESATTKLTYEERHTFDGSGRVRYTEFGTEFTVEYLIQLVLSISDNTAYRMLLEHFGVYGYNLLMRDLGTSSLFLGPENMFSSYATAQDLLRVWSAVYDYLQSDAEYASLYRKSCTDTEHAYGAMTLVDYSYSHKSGENLYRYLATNDAGVVWAETPYLYCMLANINYTVEHIEELNAIMTCVHRLMKPDSSD